MLSPMSPSSRLRATVVSVAALALVLGGCGGSDEPVTRDAITTTTAAASTTSMATTSTEAPAESEPLQILVTNDDGYAAEGIDALVRGLSTLDGVVVTVVAPLTNQSGTGGKTTEGQLDTSEVELASGHPATAVAGFPADTIRVAIDELDVTPDLVITGINEGQNIGPVVDYSGTVGAARAAVARGVPALATSQGTADVVDYDAAVPLILDWVSGHRAALVDGSAPVEVANLNVPTCSTGDLGDLVEVAPDPDGDLEAALGVQDCTESAADTTFDGDVAAFLAGHPTLSILTPAPAAR